MDENEAIRPATEGILRILKAANSAGIKRVVMTSNFGAVGFSKRKGSGITSEKDWTDPMDKGISIYEKSKLMAEQAAWEFVRSEDNRLEFTTINPVAILEPALSNHISGSFVLFDMILSGKPYPDLPLNIVDVRDVADLHIRAMMKPKASGERFIATADGQISMSEMARIIQEEFVYMMGINRNIDNSKAKELLGWNSNLDNRMIIVESIKSLIAYKIIE
ncbi:MAG: NAD-dependent epimerase/dehydratase family protein [Lachnospiraceae bacterium]